MKIFIAQNMLIILIYIVLYAVFYFKTKLHLTHIFILKFSYFAIILSFLLPILFCFLEPNNMIVKTHQIWTSIGNTKHVLINSINLHTAMQNQYKQNILFNIFYYKLIFIGIFGVFFVTTLFSYIKDFIKIKNILQKSFLFRKYKCIKVLVHNDIKIPFSTRFYKKLYVVIPYEVLIHHEKLKIIISHELQHHRQGDTLCIYFILIFKCLFALNPFAHLLIRKIYELQELACDEALVQHKNTSISSYCECLLWCAQFSMQKQSNMREAVKSLHDQKTIFLKKRILTMLSLKQKKTSTISAFLLTTGIIGGLSFAAYASNTDISDRIITMESAEKMLEKAKNNSEFPVTLNQYVLEQLNRFLGSPDARTNFKKRLENMKTYQVMVNSELRKAHLPIELSAVPLVESGYQNILQNQFPYSAGIWMFIPETAREFNLKMNEKLDQRLNPLYETKAAVEYYQQLYDKYHDWNLAVMAYNLGGKNVNELIKKTGTTDAWKLIEVMYNDDFYAEARGYLPSVMAAILIEENN